MNRFQTLVYPHQTGGGPCDPSKGPNTLSNMKSFWLNVYENDSTEKSLLQLQCHKSTYRLIQLAGSTVEVAKDVRRRQGDMNVDEYRIIVADGPEYAAIATSTKYDKLKEEYKGLHTLGEAMLRHFKDRKIAAKEIIAWTIRMKMIDLKVLGIEHEEAQMLEFELSNLKSMTPVSLANLERSYYIEWQRATEQKVRAKSEMMTWACCWEITEVMRKFQNRRIGDSFSLGDFIEPVPPPSTDESKPIRKRTQADFEEHPVYGLFFKMVRTGIPKQAVILKMKTQGLDPEILNNPHQLPTYSDAHNSTGETGSTLMDQIHIGVALKSPNLVDIKNAKVTSGPYHSVFEDVLNNSKFRSIIQHIQTQQREDEEENSEFD